MTHAAVTEARTWIGTPYRHQHSTKGAGCDCLGLLRGVYRAVIGSEPELPPNYSPSWGEAGSREFMLEAAKRWLVPVARSTEISPGDVLVFRMRRGMLAKHCAISSGQNQIIHSCMSARNVIECALHPEMKSKIAGVFSFGGISDQGGNIGRHWLASAGLDTGHSHPN